MVPVKSEGNRPAKVYSETSRSCRRRLLRLGGFIGKRFRNLAGVFIPLFLLSGCMVGPDFVRPEAPIEQQWLQQKDPRIKSETADVGNWWTVFSDPVLNRLVESAYGQNLGLRVAALRIMEARARLGVAIGFQYPQTQEIGGSFTADQLSANAPNGAVADRYFNNYTFGFDTVWELDFWGRFRRGVQSDTSVLYASMASYDDILVSLTAEVASNYILIRTLEKRLAVARENIRLQQESLRIATLRYKDGVATELDVFQARALLRQTQAAVPKLEAGLRQAKNGLAVLLGVLPPQVDDLLGGDGPIPTAPVEVAVGLPAELLHRRPDIRLAEFQAAAQSARIGIARSDLFPRLSLAGSIGLQSSDRGSALSNNASFSDLFSADSLTYMVGPTIQWPILNYGRLKNNVRIQDARLQQLLERYRDTVLRAARDVENAMVGFLRSQEERKLLSESVENYARSVEIASLQYREGSADYQRVVDNQRFLAREQDTLAQVSGSVAINLVAIYKAVGGGWELRQGRDLLPEKTRETMRQRTDWGNLLQPEQLPKNPEEKPPGGQAIPVLSRPDW